MTETFNTWDTYHVKTHRYDAWFHDREGLYFLTETELDGIGGSHRRDKELVVSRHPPFATEVHPAWNQDARWAPPKEQLPNRVELGDEWWGWWTDDLSNIELIKYPPFFNE